MPKVPFRPKPASATRAKSTTPPMAFSVMVLSPGMVELFNQPIALLLMRAVTAVVASLYAVEPTVKLSTTRLSCASRIRTTAAVLNATPATAPVALVKLILVATPCFNSTVEVVSSSKLSTASPVLVAVNRNV